VWDLSRVRRRQRDGAYRSLFNRIALGFCLSRARVRLRALSGVLLLVLSRTQWGVRALGVSAVV